MSAHNVPAVKRNSPTSRSNSGARIKSARRTVKYSSQPPGFFRRWRRRLINPYTLIPVLLLLLIAGLVLFYYGTIFSERIDTLLSNEIYTRTAGVYAAPREIRAGEKYPQERLLTHLKRAGYVEENQQADAARGRYKVSGATVDLSPGDAGIIDSKRQFIPLRVQYDKSLQTVVALNEIKGKLTSTLDQMNGGAALSQAALEPELMSAASGEDRGKRRVIGFQDVPPHLIKAITTTEDRAFFEHHGVNLRGIARAFFTRYAKDEDEPLARQGGSSITQQLVKNLLLSPEKSLKRKFAEAYMSVLLETRLSKEEIFALYCNQIYMGQQSGFAINGMGQAAQAYFGKDVTQISLPEAAFLAGTIRSPNRYNPFRHPDVALQRRNQVLDSMTEAGAITAAAAAEAKATPLNLAPKRALSDEGGTQYFSDYVEADLEKKLNDPAALQRLRVYTTIDMDLQRAANTAVTAQLARLDKLYRKVSPGTLQASLVAMNADTGEIVAMVGGRDYQTSSFNRATDAMRQPGSVFKPFVYATALQSNMTAADIYTDEPKEFFVDGQVYKPNNYGDHFSNQPVTLRDALVKSLNTITVDVAAKVGISRVMQVAEKAGMPKPKRNYLSMALGTNESTPLEVATAYTAFANNGTRVLPTALTRVTNGNGATVISPNPQKKEVFKPEIAWLMTSFMKDVVNRGTAAGLRSRGFRFNVAGKTGTSRDGWFAGYTPHLVCIVYVGFDNGDDLGLKGSDSAMPIWADFMQAALSQHPEWNGDWQQPEGIETAEINPETGQLAKAEDLEKRTEYFLRGTAPLTTGGELENDASDGEVVDSEPATTDETPINEELPEQNRLRLPSTNSGRQSESPPPAEENGENPRRPNRAPGRLSSGDFGAGRGGGRTVTVAIDPQTGLLADPRVCPTSELRTYQVGFEPKRRCNAQYHPPR